MNKAKITHETVTAYVKGTSCQEELSENDRHKSVTNIACHCCCCCCPVERPILFAARLNLGSCRQISVKSRPCPPSGLTHGQRLYCWWIAVVCSSCYNTGPWSITAHWVRRRCVRHGFLNMHSRCFATFCGGSC